MVGWAESDTKSSISDDAVPRIDARGRMLASPKDPAEVTVERLQQLNETQHRVVAYACYALTPKEDKRFLPGLVKLVLGGGWGRNREAILRDAAARSWVHARNSFSSEIWTF